MEDKPTKEELERLERGEDLERFKVATIDEVEKLRELCGVER